MGMHPKKRSILSPLGLRLALLCLAFGLLTASSCNNNRRAVEADGAADVKADVVASNYEVNALGEPIVPVDGKSDCEQSAIMLPFTMVVVGDEKDCKNCTKELSIEVSFSDVNMPDPVLELTLSPTTALEFGALKMTIKVPKVPGTVVQKIRISGDSPSVEMLMRMTGDGFAFEMHESFPPKQQLQPQSLLNPRRALPAPIEVAGQRLDEGIELRH